MSKVQFPKAFSDLFKKARYKIVYGGRSSAKSWSIARALSIRAAQGCLRILCTREYQNSISDSVHRVLVDQISAMGLSAWFVVTKNSITCPRTGSEFIFKGLHHNINGIRSTEGIDIVWIEEAQHVSKDSWELLIPTIRKENSEIWVSFNPVDVDDETYRRFVLQPPPGAIVKLVNFDQNPFHPQVLEDERQYALSLIERAKDDSERAQAQADYDHVWLGMTRRQTGAGVIKRWRVEAFETPIEGVRFYHGLDFGFANDPTAMVRSWIAPGVKGEILMIDQEAFGHQVEIDDTPALMDSIKTSREWPIKADGARPETISYLRRQGFQIAAADKWNGSVEDGIAHLNGFEAIVIHDRCKHVQREARLYSYKVDRITGDIIPLIVDAHNHGWDATRYSLDGLIQARGAGPMWDKLAS